MTRLETGKSVTRETGTAYRGRPLIVELHPRYISIHEKGKRNAVNVDYEAVYELALKLEARREHP